LPELKEEVVILESDVPREAMLVDARSKRLMIAGAIMLGGLAVGFQELGTGPFQKVSPPGPRSVT
jgi:hypothetical protein